MATAAPVKPGYEKHSKLARFFRPNEIAPRKIKCLFAFYAEASAADQAGFSMHHFSLVYKLVLDVLQVYDMQAQKKRVRKY